MVRNMISLLLVPMLLSASLVVPGCKYSDERGSTAAQAGDLTENAADVGDKDKADDEDQSLSDAKEEPPPPAKTGDPKLRSHLDDLISAYERGEAEEYAGLSGIKLLDGDKVRVSIKCVPGQLEAASEIAGTLGTVELISRRGSVQAVVPIASLTLLAEAESIRSIELPVPPEEEAD